MKRTEFFILTALAEEPRHGYGVIKATLDLTDGEVRIPVGSVYGAIDRLLTDGSIELDREADHDGRTRKYYRLTHDGRSHLCVAAERQLRESEEAIDRLTKLKPAAG